MTGFQPNARGQHPANVDPYSVPEEGVGSVSVRGSEAVLTIELCLILGPCDDLKRESLILYSRL